MSSYPKWVYGPNKAALLISDKAEWPKGYTESPADWDVQEVEKGPTKAELLEEAKALGLQVNAQDKKETIAAAIADVKAQLGS